MCPDPSALADLINHRLLPARASELVEHAGQCRQCTAALDSMRASFSGVGLGGTFPSAQAVPTHSLGRGSSLGRYVVLEQIGAGAMGLVYSAYDPRLDRRVALKLLRTVGRNVDAGLRSRLLREAQAMARLSHPNVLPIHDAGEVDGEVFIAIAFVEGRTLREWRAEKPRSWGEVVAVFLDAGRGLAAAHAAGLIHRDFKPDNVLIGVDGRVQVTDFGLAARAGAAPSAQLVSASLGGQKPLLDLSLTATGGFLGTPAYMAPEQVLGNADARSDQFSFCVALYEALHRVRPFAGTSLADLTLAAFEGRLSPPTTGSDVPDHLDRVLARGLSGKADARYPSMDALLVALGNDPRSRVRRRLLVTLGSLVAVGLVAAITSVVQSKRASCTGAEARLAGVWDGQARAALTAAFTKTGKPFASQALGRVEQGFDAWSRAWVDTHVDACEATARGAQSQRLLELRMLCLDRARRDARALVKLFGVADSEVVLRSAEAVSKLPSPATCSDIEALEGMAGATGDPRLRPRVDAIESRLSDLRALVASGKYGKGRAEAEACVLEAKAIGFGPLSCDALLVRGELELHADDPKGAELMLYETAAVCDSARSDDARARALLLLTNVLDLLAKYSEERQWVEIAFGAISRLGGDHRAYDARLLDARASIFYGEGNFAAALPLYEQASTLAHAADPGSLAEAEYVFNTGTLFIQLGRNDQAKAALEHALTLRRSKLGEEHPIIALNLSELGVIHRRLGRYAEARALYERAIAIDEKVLPPDASDLALLYSNLGTLLNVQHDYVAGESAQRKAIEMSTRVFGPDHPLPVNRLNMLATSLIGQGRLDEALAVAKQAVVGAEKNHGPAHPMTGMARKSLGKAHFARREFAAAAENLNLALGIFEPKFGADHPQVAEALTVLAEIDLENNAPGLALIKLERAVRIREAKQVAQEELAQSRFDLARAVWDSGGDRLRARALADSALEGCSDFKHERDRVAGWISSHFGVATAPDGGR